MSKRTATLLSLALLFGGCGCDEPETAASSRVVHPSGQVPGAGQQADSPMPSTTVRGTVLETMDSGGYTYMKLDTASGQIWVAAAPRTIAIGARVQVAGAIMRDFRSNTLDRTFDQLVLASAVQEVGR